jgi:1,4-dihydroxy-6-naphthoate synthase
MALRVVRVSHSPDSDDAFMFWALADSRLDTGDIRYAHELADIETLNRRALAGELEVSAVSIHAYAYLAERYALLGCGASMGDGYGPRVVSRSPAAAEPRTALAGRRVAVPGLLTTAYLALRLYQPEFEAVVIPFDQIEDAVMKGAVDAGLLIHEGQLTFAEAGLALWADLGAWWLGDTGLPLPLGGNVVRRDLGDALIARINRDLRASIQYALQHRAPALAHAERYSRGLSPDRTERFVSMYVNDWTVDWGPRGRAAVQLLLDRGAEAGVIPQRVKVDFVG